MSRAGHNTAHRHWTIDILLTLATENHRRAPSTYDNRRWTIDMPSIGLAFAPGCDEKGALVFCPSSKGRYIFMMEQLINLILQYGYVGMAAVVFTETGLLIGFCLPGDSLLFTAGLACAPENAFSTKFGIPPFDLLTLNLWLVPAAIIGDAVGYWIGYKTGEKLYQRERTWFFRRDHLLATKEFYEKHGGKTIVIARFVP
ncbi:MAG TPA: hypothetical protein VEJ63_02610, partial [Planctomycetota bacterium]|nr:hypothetical protein [Planctomycetota bacterium]